MSLEFLTAILYWIHTGLLLGYFLVAAAGLGAVASFVPSFEKLLFDYGSVISLAIFLLQVIFVNFSNSFGLTLKSNYYIAMLVYVGIGFRLHLIESLALWFSS